MLTRSYSHLFIFYWHYLILDYKIFMPNRVVDLFEGEAGREEGFLLFLIKCYKA